MATVALFFPLISFPSAACPDSSFFPCLFWVLQLSPLSLFLGCIFCISPEPRWVIALRPCRAFPPLSEPLVCKSLLPTRYRPSSPATPGIDPVDSFMEFPDLGAHCTEPSCKRLGEDFAFSCRGKGASPPTPARSLGWSLGRAEREAVGRVRIGTLSSHA